MDVLRPLFDAIVEHAYVVVFLGALIDATGLPFPGRLLLAAAGAYAAAGHGHVGVFIALAALGAMVTDQAWYATAARGSAWLIALYRRVSRRADLVSDDGVAAFVRYGALNVILGRFFTVVRVVAWPMLVRSGLGWARFTALDAVGATLWATIWVGLGWIVGDQWQQAAQSVSGWLFVAGVVVALAVVASLALRAWRRRARETGAHAISVPRGTRAAASPGSPPAPPARPRS
jgi:membrane protein DedA with SNARE-associated domain